MNKTKATKNNSKPKHYGQYPKFNWPTSHISNSKTTSKSKNINLSKGNKFTTLAISFLLQINNSQYQSQTLTTKHRASNSSYPRWKRNLASQSRSQRTKSRSRFERNAKSKLTAAKGLTQSLTPIIISKL